MKRVLLLLPFLVLILTANAQHGRKTLGLSLAPVFSTDGFISYRNLGKVNYSLLNGIFYDQDFNDHFGFKAAAIIRYDNREDVCLNCAFNSLRRPINAQNHSYYLDVPLNMAFNLNKDKASNFRTYILLGYTYSRLVYFYQTATSLGQPVLNKAEDMPQDRLRTKIHTVNLGLDFRFHLNRNLMLGFNPEARLPVFYINDPAYIALKLNIGRNL